MCQLELPSIRGIGRKSDPIYVQKVVPNEMIRLTPDATVGKGDYAFFRFNRDLNIPTMSSVWPVFSAMLMPK